MRTNTLASLSLTSLISIGALLTGCAPSPVNANFDGTYQATVARTFSAACTDAQRTAAPMVHDVVVGAADANGVFTTTIHTDSGATCTLSMLNTDDNVASIEAVHACTGVVAPGWVVSFDGSMSRIHGQLELSVVWNDTQSATSGCNASDAVDLQP